MKYRPRSYIDRARNLFPIGWRPPSGPNCGVPPAPLSSVSGARCYRIGLMGPAGPSPRGFSVLSRKMTPRHPPLALRSGASPTIVKAARSIVRSAGTRSLRDPAASQPRVTARVSWK